MRFAISVPNLGPYADLEAFVRIAREAEDAGWDGFFTWDSVWLGAGQPIIDPWVALAAVASVTERIRIGPMVTPIARRRPWKLARETVTLDHLSKGRLTLGVGLGDPSDLEFEAFGDEGDLRTRGRILDEGLEVLRGLWSGLPFSHSGEYYRVSEAAFLPTPVQAPRIPVWVGGSWPKKPPFRRAARWDGTVPQRAAGGPLSPEEVKAAVAYISAHRASKAAFDVVISTDFMSGEPDRRSEVVAAYADAGATWLVHAADPERDSVESTRDKVRDGPPAA